MTNQHGHVNCLRHDEVTSRDIPNLSDRRSYARSRSSNIVARFVDFNKDTGDVHYSVTSQAKAGKSYTVTFRFKDWNPDMAHLDDEIQNAVKGNIEIDCTCPAFTYQGYKFLASVKGGSVDIERRPPNETNPDRHGYACKHILKAIDSFNQDFDKFRAEGKGMIKKHNLRVHHKYERRQTLESSSSYSLSEKLDMRFVTYCDEVLGIHLSSLKSSSLMLSIAKALHDYMEQLMKICDIGNTYDALKRVFATGNPKGFDEKNRDKYERLVNTLKHHFRSLSGGVFEVHEARGGSTGHFPTDIRIEFGLEDNGQNLWVNSLRIPFTLCFSSSGQFRLLSGRSLEDKISECVADEVSAISDDWDKTRRDIYSDVVEESNMKTRRNNRKPYSTEKRVPSDHSMRIRGRRRFESSYNIDGSELKKWAAEHCIDRLDEMEGVEVYMDELADELTEQERIYGSVFRSTQESWDFISQNRYDAGDVLEEWVSGTGSCKPNPLSEPDAFCVLLLEHYVRDVLYDCPSVESLGGGKHELTRELIDAISEYLEQFC